VSGEDKEKTNGDLADCTDRNQEEGTERESRKVDGRVHSNTSLCTKKPLVGRSMPGDKIGDVRTKEPERLQTSTYLSSALGGKFGNMACSQEKHDIDGGDGSEENWGFKNRSHTGGLPRLLTKMMGRQQRASRRRGGHKAYSAG